LGTGKEVAGTLNVLHEVPFICGGVIKHTMFYHKAEVPAAVRPFPNWLLGASQGREVQHPAWRMGSV